MLLEIYFVMGLTFLLYSSIIVYAVIRPSEIMTAVLSDSRYTQKRKADLSMKKTIAIAAAVIALLACGCGKVNEEVRPTAANVTADTSSVSESTSVESSEAAESAAEENSSLAESSEGESGEENETHEKIANIEGYKGEYINDGNCVILNPHNAPEVDRDMLYYAAEQAVKQYNCIAKRDKQGFFDTIGFDRILSSENALRYWTNDYSEEEFGREMPEELYFPTVRYCHALLGDELSNALDISSADEKRAEIDRLLKKAAENKSADNADFLFDADSNDELESMSCFNKLCHKYKNIDDSEFFSQPEKFVLTPSENTKYIIKYSCASSRLKDEGVYISIDVVVLDGEYSYHFDQCNMLLSRDESCVMPFYVAVSENRWKGLAVNEAGKKIYDEYYSEEAKTAAALDNDAWEVIIPDAGYDSDFPAPEPPTWDELTASGVFALAASENGLDLSKDEPEAEGDKYLKEYSGIEEGTVYLIHESNGTSLFYIRYVSPDGKTGEYHNEDNGWF